MLYRVELSSFINSFIIRQIMIMLGKHQIGGTFTTTPGQAPVLLCAQTHISCRKEHEVTSCMILMPDPKLV